ncbi:GGDEF domain-containing protein [Noviherbaspirillum sp. CPCC 100848]|uniref:diguanylate cyclase n=1 Tax=Noviherbaspirillum album TaxID=3080276 RepID=A0ABU6J6Y7_9BURK|nr:GGDEF domain-containing protein [Noviherbaspirillum sp. CPCC 100848]MEC4719052.1 GGDEF domain-containing protein [Noviherbaspirillum sp. CPCC 100848]
MQSIQAAHSDVREGKRQRHRLYMARLLILNMAIESAELALFAIAGTIPVSIAVLFLAVGFAVSSGFYLVFRLGLNLRFKQKNLLIPQLLVFGGIQIVFMFLAPKLSILFLLVLVVLSGYAAIEFNPRQYTIGWLVYGAATALAMILLGDRFDYPGHADMEVGLVWLFFFMTLRSLTLANASFSRLREKLLEKNRQLEQSLHRIEDMANRDYLTGVHNRRHFMSLLEMELQRSARSGRAFCLVMLDLDWFKAINDRFGHPVGDVVLQRLCLLAGDNLRAVDQVGRIGGEEFAILLPDASLDSGYTTIDRLRAAVHAYDWQQVADGLQVSFSAGVAAYGAGDSVHMMIKRADDALYEAKHAGRNRVQQAGAMQEAQGRPDPEQLEQLEPGRVNQAS